jgi:alpha/beta superfamily hydrolase
VARRIESHWIEGPAGRLEALLEEPEDREPLLAALVCHPHPLHGGTMHNKVVYRVARGLRHGGAVVLRFNFRGVGASQGEHAHLTGEIEDARAALAWLRQRYPAIPFGLAGFSFGSRAITRLGCDLAGARWLMAVGYPTHYGSTEYFEACAIPKVIIQSTHDQYGPRAEMEALYERLTPPKELIWVEATDHFFAGGLDDLEARVGEVISKESPAPATRPMGDNDN